MHTINTVYMFCQLRNGGAKQSPTDLTGPSFGPIDRAVLTTNFTKLSTVVNDGVVDQPLLWADESILWNKTYYRQIVFSDTIKYSKNNRRVFPIQNPTHANAIDYERLYSHKCKTEEKIYVSLINSDHRPVRIGPVDKVSFTNGESCTLYYAGDNQITLKFEDDRRVHFDGKIYRNILIAWSKNYEYSDDLINFPTAYKKYYASNHKKSNPSFRRFRNSLRPVTYNLANRKVS